METRLPNLGVVTNFFMLNYPYLSVGLLWVKEKSIRFYAREHLQSDKYKDALIVNLSPKRIEMVYAEGISEVPITDGFYAFDWTYESFGKWKKIDVDDNIADIIWQTLFGKEIKKILEEINETSPILYEEASGSINPKIFSKDDLFLIENVVVPYFPSTVISNEQIINRSYLPLFLQADFDNEDRGMLPRAYVQIEPFIFLSKIFENEVFINPDKPAAPVIFGKESILNPEPSALLFPPSWAEKLIVAKIR